MLANVSAIIFTQFAALDCKQRFLGFLPWNAYLTADPATCAITNFHVLGADSSLLLIFLAILDDLFMLVGLLAVAFVIFAGFQYILSQGAPDQAAKARTTAINALVGIGISLVAIATTSFIGTQVGNQSAQSSSRIDLTPLPNANASGTGLIHTALSISFGILGAIAFLVIVIAGFQYVLAQGDPQATGKARTTIIYALVGLVLAVVAESVVSFALSTAH